MAAVLPEGLIPPPGLPAPKCEGQFGTNQTSIQKGWGTVQTAKQSPRTAYQESQAAPKSPKVVEGSDAEDGVGNGGVKQSEVEDAQDMVENGEVKLSLSAWTLK